MSASDQSAHGAPVWLFSFVDLAFLLLIALTQAQSAKTAAVELGELVIPKIKAEAEGMPASAPMAWQLRVHPKDDAQASPFELVSPSAPGGDGTRISEDALRARFPDVASDADESYESDPVDASGWLKLQQRVLRTLDVAPQLTTVELPYRRMGEAAARLLLGDLRGDEPLAAGRRVEVKGELRWRASVVPGTARPNQ